MLKLTDVHTYYGSIEILKGISMEVEEGSIVTIIGANGAGKTTTLMTISGINRPVKGKVLFDGQEIQGLSPDRIVKMGISQVPEGRRIFPRLTVLENLQMGAFIRKDKKEIEKDMEEVFYLFPVLEERLRQLGGTLSGGEQQMLAIARALMSRPRLLLMDEPSLGLAPIMAEKIFKTLSEINKKGTTILLVEQNAYAALRLANFGYVMETGRIVMADRSEALIKDPRIKEAYLGEGPQKG